LSFHEGDQLTHLDASGQVHMVDVSQKQVTVRRATAECWVHMSERAFEALVDGRTLKGDVMATVRVAALMGLKKTSELIPLCHPLPVEWARCDLSLHEPDRVRITVEVSTSGKTGVEMEAMTGASVGGLVLYDMLKALDKGMVVGPTQLVRKEGGKSGLYQRGDTDES
jgi:cyclic pyranopterin phosphate synthase